MSFIDLNEYLCQKKPDTTQCWNIKCLVHACHKLHLSKTNLLQAIDHLRAKHLLFLFLKSTCWKIFFKNTHFLMKSHVTFLKLTLEREKQWFVIYAFIVCFLYVPWMEIKPETLVYQDNALTNWAIQSGPHLHFHVSKQLSDYKIIISL